MYEFTISARRLRAILQPFAEASDNEVLRFTMDGDAIVVETLGGGQAWVDRSTSTP